MCFGYKSSEAHHVDFKTACNVHVILEVYFATQHNKRAGKRGSEKEPFIQFHSERFFALVIHSPWTGQKKSDKRKTTTKSKQKSGKTAKKIATFLPSWWNMSCTLDQRKNALKPLRISWYQQIYLVFISSPYSGRTIFEKLIPMDYLSGGNLAIFILVVLNKRWHFKYRTNRYLW